MKRTPRGLPDMDLHGRIRRHPAAPSLGRFNKVRLLGGPLDGREMQVPGNPDVIPIGPKGAPFWSYTYAGRDGHIRMYAIRVRKLDIPKLRAPNGSRDWPTPRNKRRYSERVLMRAIGNMGSDPRVQAQLSKDKPKTGGRVNPAGRGARRRGTA